MKKLARILLAILLTSGFASLRVHAQSRLTPETGDRSRADDPQSKPAQAADSAKPTNPALPDGVKYFSSSEVETAFAKGSPLINKDGRSYWVLAGRRDKPGQSELHEKDTDVFYILEGSASFVTGGKMVEPKSTGPGEVRGSAIDGGDTRTLSKGDVIIIPAGVPHWFKDVQGTFLYLVVKVQ